MGCNILVSPAFTLRPARLALFVAFLLAGCGGGEQKPADPLAGLSDIEKRAAKAHAANLCSAAKGSTDDSTLADAAALASDVAVGINQGDPLKVLGAGTALARAHGCVPAGAELPNRPASPTDGRRP